MNDTIATRPQRAGRWFLLFAAGLLLTLLVLALLQGAARQATRGTGPALPEPVNGAAVSPLCVNAALQIYPDPDTLTHNLDRIAAAGFVWVRQTFPWSAIERAPGVYNWAPWDTIVQSVAAHPAGLELIAVIDDAPDWAIGGAPRSGAQATPPADPADLGRFATALATRYGDRINVYQIWDEPNLSSHWGGRDVNPAGYAALLQAAAPAIRDADEDATLLLAGLAPTTETGPRNLSDVRYLEALYALDTAPYFDVAAGKPYGFDSDPLTDQRPSHDTLNFSRLLLLRQVMLAHGDGDTALWASHWGWNALPAGWTGAPSIWGQTDEASRAVRTVAALERARREWPWSGALCLENWQPDAPEDDPRWGFALLDQHGTPRPTYDAIMDWAAGPPTNFPGFHPARDPGQLRPQDAGSVAKYEGEWHFSELGADVTQSGEHRVVIPFVGTELGLRVRRGDYRAYAFVTIDGAPANALPQDDDHAYLVLSSPDQQPQVTTLPVARGLSDGAHTAEVTFERGWGQWPLVGWSVGWWPHAQQARYRQWQRVVGGLALLCGAGMVWSAWRVWRDRRSWRRVAQGIHRAWQRLSDGAQIAITATTTLVLWASAWLTWGQERAAGEGGLIATVAAATLFYVSPVFLLSLLSLGLLALLVILRPDLGLALIAFAAPFYLQSRPMFDRAFSVVEIAVLLSLVAWGVQWLLARKRAGGRATQAGRNTPRAVTLLDGAMLFFVAVASLSLCVAELKGVALREFRIIVLEPALFYLMLRATPLDQRARWRIVDAFVLGAVLVALVGLYQYFFTADVITAEGGMRRLKSVYGSPNNVGLYLGRVLPLLVAIVLLGRDRRRRWLYGAAALVTGAALLLSFSKGALLFGVPAALLTLGLLAGGRWLWATLGALGAAALAALPLLRTPRFNALFDLQSGTSFFRLHLWRSSVDMIRDHLVLGVGLDNFLYAYRGRYIRPDAWQEPDLSHPHNLVLDYWSRLGILGLMAGLWLQAAFWRLALPLRRLKDPNDRALALGLMASMVDFLAHGLVDNSYFVVDLAFAFCLTLGLVVQLSPPSNSPERGT